MNLPDLADAIAGLAHEYGYLVTTPAPLYDHTGGADLTLAGHGRLMHVLLAIPEVHEMTIDRHAWIEVLGDSPGEVHRWRHYDWTAGRIDTELDPQTAARRRHPTARR